MTSVMFMPNANLPQRLLDFFKFEWLDDGDDAFHGMPPSLDKKVQIKLRPWRLELPLVCKKDSQECARHGQTNTKMLCEDRF
jgi:hypothetical protein